MALFNNQKNYNTSPNIKKGPVQINFSFKPYTVANIIDDLKVNKIVTNNTKLNNIAVSIQTIYFYKDMISQSRSTMPYSLYQNLLRNTIIEAFSVLECIEIELGARLLGISRDNPSYNHKETDKSCYSIVKTKVRSNVNSRELDFYNNFRESRNNVHLSKGQNIFDQNVLNEKSVVTYVSFMIQYIEYMVRWYDLYLESKTKFKFQHPSYF